MLCLDLREAMSPCAHLAMWILMILITGSQSKTAVSFSVLLDNRSRSSPLPRMLDWRQLCASQRPTASSDWTAPGSMLGPMRASSSTSQSTSRRSWISSPTGSWSEYPIILLVIIPSYIARIQYSTGTGSVLPYDNSQVMVQLWACSRGHHHSILIFSDVHYAFLPPAATGLDQQARPRLQERSRGQFPVTARRPLP